MRICIPEPRTYLSGFRGEPTMIQMSHILVLSQPEFVKRQLNLALGGWQLPRRKR